MLEQVQVGIVLVAAALWVGAIVFHSGVVAPSVFRSLDESAARDFLRMLFPRFYRFGLVCGTIMAAAIAVIAVTGGRSTTLLALATVTFVMLALQVISLSLVPLINSARDAGESGAIRFARLHRLSVALTVSVLLLGIVVIAALGAAVELPGRA